MNKITDDILCKVEKPSRYVGGELNQVIKNPEDVNIRFAFCFPDVYEVGMSHLGTRILYHTINERKDTYCERVFAPWPDMEALMRENDIKLFTLETKTPLDKFDMLGFTLQYEMSYTNILNDDLKIIFIMHEDELIEALKMYGNISLEEYSKKRLGKSI